MKARRQAHRYGALLVIGAFCVAILSACGASMERTARSELAERGLSEVTLHAAEDRSNTYSFEGSREGVPCRGEIELRQEMGQTVATVTSQCGEE